jgi:hypothetical protein
MTGGAGDRNSVSGVGGSTLGGASLPPGVRDLRALVSAARDSEVPGLLGALEEARAECWRRLVALGAPRAAPRTDDESDLLLTIPDVAQRLAVRVDYAYALARQGKLPVVRLPGLEKGGRQRDGKHVRVRATVLREWIRARERERLEKEPYVTYSRTNDGR